MHHFSLPFLERMAGYMEHNAPFHQARKTIPSLHGPVKVRLGPCLPLSELSFCCSPAPSSLHLTVTIILAMC